MAFDPNSREAEAQAEMAATRLSRGAAATLLAGVLALLASGPVLELVAVARGRSAVLAPIAAPADRGPLATMEAWSEELELRLDERSALVRAVRPAVQELLIRFGRYGNERVIVGRNGWLFFRYDVEHLTSKLPGAGFAGDPDAAIRHFAHQLAARGIGLVLVPIPVKPTVHPEMLDADARAPVRRSGEADMISGLVDGGIEVVDLADRFAREANLLPQYLPTDTHWRPEAVETAAREIAIRLRERFELDAGDASFRKKQVEMRPAQADMVKMFELENGGELFESVEVELHAVERPTDGTSSVVLLGDSFAGIYGEWNASLADRLAANLGLPVDRVLENGGGASGARQTLSRSWLQDPARFANLRVVVWQFAARELSHNPWLQVDLPPEQ